MAKRRLFHNPNQLHRMVDTYAKLLRRAALLQDDILTGVLSPPPEPTLPKMILHLSPQQKQVCRMVRDGYSTKEMAGMLHTTEQSVKNRLSHCFEVLDVNDRVELAAILLLPLDSPLRRAVQESE